MAYKTLRDQYNISDSWIVSRRDAKNKVDPLRPYHYLSEKELGLTGSIETVSTIFLTNRECPFRCLMCDLWKNTTDSPLPAGAIPEQIRYALARLPASDTIKLYNNGNFFDKGAIPPADYSVIAGLLQSCKTVVVENHPRLLDDSCLRFRDMLRPELQVAIGLETTHPEVLPALNKQMTLKDFEAAVQFLTSNNIAVRTFILLRPPLMEEDEGLRWTCNAIKFAFDAGVAVCTVIPTRKGNGAMDYFKDKGLFHEPSLSSLEKALEYGITLGTGHVFADLWDIRMFNRCETCFDRRLHRLSVMNATQKVPEPVICKACT